MEQTLRSADISYRHRKYIVTGGAIAILVIVLIAGLLPRASALWGLDLAAFQTTYGEYLDAVEAEVDSGLFSAVADVFADGSGQDTAASEAMRTAASSLRQSRVFIDIAIAIKGLGIFLVFLYASIALIRETERGDGDLEMWGKFGIVMLAGFIVIENWTSLATGLQQIGNGLVNLVYRTVSSQNLSGEGLGAKLNEWFAFDGTFNDVKLTDNLSLGNFINGKWFDTAGKWFADLGLFVLTIGKGLAVSIILLFLELPLIEARITVLSILMEIYLRQAFFPIAIADVAGNGPRSPGIGYMKKFLALYIRVGLCIVIAGMCQIMIAAVVGSLDGTFIASIFKLIMIYVLFRLGPKMFGATGNIAASVMGT